ncbi:hypothetical protein F5Y14DRAFT_440623 [Nemania sp. NC0429]|nr:hypothetical protein F5Y14DRAFT_440623 [Nemania sp. NC0429]
MAEAQEQPQAQPQPEPASAVTEDTTHALPPAPSEPWPERPSQHSSQAASGQEKPTEAQIWAPTPPEADTNASQQQERIRQSPDPQAPDAAREPEIATTQEPEKEPAQEKGLEDRGYQLQQDHVSDAPIPTSTSTSTSTTTTTSTTISTPPASSSSTLVTKSTVATDPSNAPTTPTPLATTIDAGASQDQQKAQDDQPEKDGAAAPPTDTMSHNQPHMPGPPRQPLPYSTSSAYAAGGMSNAHYAYANAAPPTHDPYRASSHATTNNAMPLPSMRTFDSVQQQSQQQQHMAMAVPISPVPSVSGQQSLSYYGPQVMGNPYASLSPEAMGQRYALPPSGPGAVMTAGRHKKRRTKTGCLTCRKRRIKCDELHPTCKNCQKSKRECLGYDPIFKNQQQQQQPLSQTHQPQQSQQPHHATSSIHSTHNSVTPTSASSTSSIPRSVPSASASASAPVSTPLTPGTATSYTAGPLGLPSGAAPPPSTYSPDLASVGNSGVSNIKTEGHSYHTLDHSLDSVLTTSSMSTSHFPAATPVVSHIVDYRTRGSPHLRGGGPSFVPLHPTSSHPSPSPYMERTPAYSGIPARKMKVHELVAIGNAVPPSVDGSLSQERLLEVQDLYEQVYAPGLEKFFETDWYLKPCGSNALASNPRVQEVLSAFLASLASTTTSDVAGMAYSANLEFRVVWELATLVYSNEYKANVSYGLPATEDGNEARNRAAVFDALLSGEFLDHNPLRIPLENPDNAVYHKNRELRFWHCLAEFLLIRDQPNIDMTPRRDQILAQLRELLDGRENRDVLYSLTVIRALTHKFAPDFESTLPPHLDESDPKSKLAVARKFIQDEARVTGGTTNVVRRFSELGVRAFIAPAYNIVR